MGCDIHVHYEIRKSNQWEHLNWKERYIIGHYDDGCLKYDYDHMFNDTLYVGRNYSLFSILANVRNGCGFAGVPTSRGFTPIDMPRGLPFDVTAETREDCLVWGCDGHSHSWLGLQEILDYDWDNQIVTVCGVVTPEEYKVFKETGKPHSWCGGAGGREVVMVSQEEMEQVIESGGLPDRFYYTRVEWNETYREAVGKRWFKTLGALKELAEPRDIRLVFWFDN
jgi:hypothetical protein